MAGFINDAYTLKPSAVRHLWPEKMKWQIENLSALDSLFTRLWYQPSWPLVRQQRRPHGVSSGWLRQHPRVS
jgi:hypothetical protein